MELKWLEDFLAVAHERSFSRAAHIRSITQSALSRRVRSLEAWAGSSLVDRSSFPLQLTSAGLLFRDHAEEILRKALDVRALVRSDAPGDRGMLRVAAGHSLSLNFYPSWLRQVNTGFREIKTRVLATNVHDAVMSLVEDGCDLLFCYHHPQLPLFLDAERYPFITIGEERVLPYSVPRKDGRPAFAFPGTPTKPIRALTYSQSTFFGRTVEVALKHAPSRCHFRPMYESDQAEVLKKLALEGYGAAWLPVSSVTQELNEGRLVRAAEDSWSIKVAIRLIRANGNPSPLLGDLWTYLGAGRSGNR